MKSHILILTYCCTILSVFVGKVDSQNLFSAVTAPEGLVSLYLRMTIREPHIEPDDRIDADTKGNICHSITRSGFFVRRKVHSVDMDTIFSELGSRAQRELKNVFLHEVMHDYEAKGIWRTMFTYPTRLTSVEASSTQIAEEYGFACATRQRKNDENWIDLYLISDAYDINSALDFSDEEGPIRGRFVFHCVSEGCALLAMAEEPARAFAGVDYSVEEIYLRMRKYYDVARTKAEDSVCGLPVADKVRVCAVVMNSIYFAGKISFLPEETRVRGECHLTRVSLQTKEAMLEAQGESYKEWMLPCAVEPKVSDARDTYYVSRAYHSHHAIVYSRDRRTGASYIENISANISVIVERHMKIRVESEGKSPPNLVHQLRMVDEL